MSVLFNPFKPEFIIVIFIHYKPRIAVAILDMWWMKMIWSRWKSKENCHVLVNQFHWNFRSKTLSCGKIKSVFRDLKWCFKASCGLKGLNDDYPVKRCQASSYLIVIYTHLNLCVATLNYNFKWVKIAHICLIWDQSDILIVEHSFHSNKCDLIARGPYLYVRFWRKNKMFLMAVVMVFKYSVKC